MKAEFIVLSADHYSMETPDGKRSGLNVRILGGQVNNDFKFGRDVVKVQVADYNELEYLKRFKTNLPAKFKANQELIMIKDARGNEKGGIQVSNLEFICEIDFIDKKIPVKS